MTDKLIGNFTLNPREEQSFRKSDLEARAAYLINLIAVEFKTDPMSVQCFDLRLVEEAKSLSDEMRSLPEYDERYDGPPLRARSTALGDFGYGYNAGRRYDHRQ